MCDISLCYDFIEITDAPPGIFNYITMPEKSFIFGSAYFFFGAL